MFEFFKGTFVMLMGFCALALVHKDAWWYAESLLALFHISTDRRSAQMFLDFADEVTDAPVDRRPDCLYLCHSALHRSLWPVERRTWAEW
jgi:hypothetical protein